MRANENQRIAPWGDDWESGLSEPDSATGDTADPLVSETDSCLGRAFVEALGAKDFERLAALLDRQIDFRGLTPGRAWEATDSDGVVEGVLRQWFEDSDEIEQVLAIETDSFADRERVGYRLRVRNPDGVADPVSGEPVSAGTGSRSR